MNRPGDRAMERAFTTEDTMEFLRKLRLMPGYFSRGQTLAEYVLIVAALAVVAFAGYQATGSTISTLVTNVDGQM